MFLFLFILGFSSGVNAAIIDQAEYFFDADPGEGQGTPIPITPGGGPGVPMQVDLPGIDTTGLSVGMHRLYLRAHGSDGLWGPSREYLFQVSYPESNISAAEIFLDYDPRAGFGIPVTAPVDGSFDEWIESIDVSLNTIGWTAGPHTIYMRARNNLGIWGPSTPIFNNAPSNVTVEPNKWVVRAEYFIDSDPGEGYAFSLPLRSQGGSGVPAVVDLSGISTSELAQGPHTLYFRAQDSEGMWGPIRQTPITVISTLITLAGAEFFVDLDPGPGNGTPLVPYDGTLSGGSEQTTGLFDTAGLVPGDHTLCARARDNTNEWSNVPSDHSYPWCVPFSIQANQYVVSGTISEQGTGLPLNGVRVSSDDGSESYSQFDGSYALGVTQGLRALTISMGGYQSETGSVNVVNPVTPYSFALVKVETPLGVQRNQGAYAEPVNTATGNYYFAKTDLKVPAPGSSFEFTRYYNAQDLTSSALGSGWSHNLDVRIYQGSDLVIVKYGDGHEERYQSDGLGNYIPEPGNYTRIFFVAGSYYELLTKDQIRYGFDATGRLTALTDRNGNTLNINRNGLGLIENVTDPANRIYPFSYDVSGFLSSITDPLGRVIQYRVDFLGNLSSVTDADGGTTRYAYDSHHLLLTVTDPKGNIIVSNAYDTMRRIVDLQKDARGSTTTFVYDPISRTTTITDPLSGVTKHIYDERLRLIEERNPLGFSVVYAYDANNNRTGVTDRNGGQTAYSYDAQGNVLTKTDAMGNITSITYDINNNPLTRTDPLAYTTTFEYDANGNLTKTIDPLGHFTAITYDPRGLPLTLTDPNGNTATNAYDAEGNLISVTDPLGNQTAYAYDGVGRRLTATDALGRVTTYAYDNDNNLQTVTDPLAQITGFTYDGNNNKLTATDPMGHITSYAYDVKDLLTTVTDPLGGVMAYAYDPLDRKTSVTDKNGNVTALAYDPAGNLIEATDPLGNKTVYSYDSNGNKLTETDPLGHTTSYGYDALNRMVSVTDPLGNVTTSAYDNLGRVVSTTNAKGQVAAFEYDPLGRLTKVTDANGGIVSYSYDANGNRLTQTDPNGNVTTYVYDALNRMTLKTEPLGGLYQYAYDVVGNVVSLTDPKGNTLTYTYDALNRLVTTTYPDASAVSLAYDADGNRAQMTDSMGTSSYAYDVLNRMTGYTDPFGKTVGYGYDANGNRTSLTYPDGKVALYGYDGLNRLVSVADWLTRTTAYTYDAAGRLAGTVNPNATTAAYTYDVGGRLSGLTNAKADATVISSYTYTLDPLGNHSQVVQNEPVLPNVPGENIAYTYDAENQLTGAGGVANTFDANGNMTVKGSDFFAYDFSDRLIQSAIGGVVSQYRYDGTGNRLEKVVDGATTRYVLDINGSLSHVIAETDGNGAITAYYVHGLGLVSKILPDGTAHFYHYDFRGSTVALTDTSQTITDAYAYDPFGRLINQTGTTDNPFRYVGGYGLADEGNGLLYVRARYYMPEMGRFISKDPLTGRDEDSQSLNRYVYALNNPAKLVDVSGLYSWGDFLSLAVKTTSMQVVKDMGKNVIKGVYTGVVKLGARTFNEVSGAVEGTLAANMGGWNILGTAKKAVISVAVTASLDAIEGKGKDVPVLSWIPYLGDILFRYHEAGGDLDCSGRDVEYCKSIQGQAYTRAHVIDNVPFIPESYEIQSNKNATFKK